MGLQSALHSVSRVTVLSDFPSGRVAVTLYCGVCAVDTAHVMYYTPLDDIGQLLTQAADPVDFMCQVLMARMIDSH